MERNYARHRSYGNAFIALRGHYLTTGFYYLIEYARLDDVRLYSGSLRFGRRQYDFVTVRGGGFRTVVMSVVMLMAGAFVRMVVPFVVMPRMSVFFRFVIMSFTGLAVTGA